MTNFLDDTTLQNLLNTLKSNIGRGTKEKIGENTYEVEGINDQIKSDIEWLQTQESKVNSTLRTTNKTVDRYGTR